MRAALIFLSLFNAVAGLMLSVIPNGEECIYERVAKDNKLSGSFEVTSGGDFDISVIVSGPTGENHYKQLRSKSGSFQLYVCFFSTVLSLGGLYFKFH